MLFEESEEFGNFTGIGLLKGKVKTPNPELIRNFLMLDGIA